MNSASTKKELVAYLKKRGLKSSFPRKDDLIKYLKDIKWSLDFPWREEQLEIIDTFMTLHTSPKKIIGLQGIFGAGKTTMLLGMLNMGYWKDLLKMDEVCFCAFNVCIKDEIRKKIGSWGCKAKVNVRTFDSLIYEFCRFYEYEHLKLPNYKGKRLFIYKLCRQRAMKKVYEKYHMIKYLFVDECQDLENQSFDVFKTFFPNACIIFVGDIFQSVQKEPRESLLWYVSQLMDKKDVHYFYMKNTPRVPQNILGEIKNALSMSYPEYSSQITDWESSNMTDNNNIEWIPFDSYQKLYEKMFEFMETYPVEKSMILTFSSCITVKGALGDLARVRRIIQQKGYRVNSNYKSMDKSALFLSTVNSSKGLERDYVFILSTFPLEKAFINFSNDLTTNLVTVGLSRAKKKVFMCIPTTGKRFSSAFHAFDTCPKPISIGNEQENVEEMTKENFFFLEHNVTELLRQNIIQYETRILFKSFVKKRIESKVFENDGENPPIPKSCLMSEEERSFVGVCIEVLMTSTWTRHFPSVPDVSDIQKNPYYSHCIRKIEFLRGSYAKMKNMYATTPTISFNFFKTVFLYTELIMAIQHKMFFYFTVSQKQDLFQYWKSVYFRVDRMRPHSNAKFQVQSNVKMPLLTGIADGILNDKQKHIYEIKASTKNDWKEDAFVQAFCYAIMIGQSWFHIKLVNLFKNSQVEYIVYIPNVRHVRQTLLYDVFIWNASSYLAKKNPVKNMEKYIFVNCEWNDLEDKLEGIVMLRMLSPTRIHLEYHTHSLDTFYADMKEMNYDAFEFIHCYPEKYHRLLFPNVDSKYNDAHHQFPSTIKSVYEKHAGNIQEKNIVLEMMDFITK